MRCVVVLATLISIVTSQIIAESTSNDVVYNFYNQKTQSNPVVIHIDNIDDLISAGFEVNKKTVFCIYSFEEPSIIESKSNLKTAILKNNDVNVFIVDWSPVSGQNYIEAQGVIINVGTYVADFIKALVDKYKLDLTTVTLIGWDLGAHVAGTAGKALQSKVSTIIGLDPSGPLFSVNNKLNRLDSTDAQFVQVIHTNNIINGYSSPCGSADYYPNGGTIQNSCGNDVTGVCSHERSLSYYAESLSTDKFAALKCSNYEDYQNGACKDSGKSVMGQLEVDIKAEGTYYLDTNNDPPYSKG